MGIQKKAIHDLAIWGNAPSFKEPLHVGRPNIGNRQHFLQLINDMLDRKWFTNDGPYVTAFEKEISEYTGAKHCIAMCNGTIALEIVIRALELKGEVIVPSFTFIATAHSLQWQEITPVFCDIDSHTHLIDVNKIEKMITPRTTGILGVHTWGRPCDITTLESLALKFNLKLIFDAAHAFGCSYNGKMIGNFGSAEVFSFHATKCFNTFEGGAVLTNNDALAEKIRLMKNFGFAGYDNVIYIGTNGKMTEVCAAMGLTNLESFEDIVAVNHNNYECYKAELRNIPGISLLPFKKNEKQNYQYIVLEIDETKAGLNRDDILKVLHSENVLARRYFYPGCHCMAPYNAYFPHAGLLLEETDRVAHRVLVMPTGTSIDDTQIKTICSIIRVAIDNSSFIKNKLMDIS